MPYPLEWDTSTGEQKKMPALKVNRIHGVWAYDGYRNPLTRSSSNVHIGQIEEVGPERSEIIATYTV